MVAAYRVMGSNKKKSGRILPGRQASKHEVKHKSSSSATVEGCSSTRRKGKTAHPPRTSTAESGEREQLRSMIGRAGRKVLFCGGGAGRETSSTTASSKGDKSRTTHSNSSLETHVPEASKRRRPEKLHKPQRLESCFGQHQTSICRTLKGKRICGDVHRLGVSTRTGVAETGTLFRDGEDARRGRSSQHGEKEKKQSTFREHGPTISTRVLPRARLA